MMRSIGVAVVAAVGIAALSAYTNPPTGGGTGARPGGGGTSREKIVAQVVEDQRIAATLPPDVAERGAVTAAITYVAPIKYIDSDGKIAGLDPDSLQAAGKVLGITVSFQQASFDAQMPGLDAKRFDLIASAGDFVERQAHIDFIDCLKAGTAILAA